MIIKANPYLKGANRNAPPYFLKDLSILMMNRVRILLVLSWIGLTRT